MCDASEASREHVPPQCFFPEQASIGRDLRKNLITVPSCDQHNSKKSKDDEFFRTTVIMASVRNSGAAQHQFLRKLRPAAARKPDAYAAFFEDVATISGGQDAVLKLNRTRFDACVDHLVRALYFHNTARKWSHPIGVASPDFFAGIEQEQLLSHQPSMRAIEASRNFLANAPNKGENDEVFVYRLVAVEDVEMLAFAGLFYDSFEVFAYSAGPRGEAAAKGASNQSS